MDLHTMIDRANAQLAKRKASLKDTLEALELIKPLESATPGAYTHTIKQLEAKAFRQNSAVQATEGLIKSFTAALKKPTK